MRWLLFSDLHLRPESAAVCAEVLGCVKALVHARAIDRVGFLGDWWHEAERLHVSLIEQTRAFWASVPGGRLLRGNHDTYARDQASALQVFELHAQVVHDHLWDDGALWLAHDQPAALVEKIALYPATHTVLMHAGLRGALRNNTQADTDGLDAAAFGGSAFAAPRVLLGHYHKPQDLALSGGGLATYVGSQWQVSAAEAGQQKRVLIWDSKARTTESVDVTCGPRFVQVVADAAGHADLSGIVPGVKVRATAPDEASRQVLCAALTELGITDFSVTPQRVTAAGATVSVQGEGLEGYMRAIVERRVQDAALRAPYEALIGELLSKVGS